MSNKSQKDFEYISGQKLLLKDFLVREIFCIMIIHLFKLLKNKILKEKMSQEIMVLFGIVLAKIFVTLWQLLLKRQMLLAIRQLIKIIILILWQNAVLGLKQMLKIIMFSFWKKFILSLKENVRGLLVWKVQEKFTKIIVDVLRNILMIFRINWNVSLV